MLGGGSAIENFGLSEVASAMPMPSSSQRARHAGSTVRGSKTFSMGGAEYRDAPARVPRVTYAPGVEVGVPAVGEASGLWSSWLLLLMSRSTFHRPSTCTTG